MRALVFAAVLAVISSSAQARYVSKSDSVTIAAVHQTSINLFENINSLSSPTAKALGQTQTPAEMKAHMQDFVCLEILEQGATNLMVFTANLNTEAMFATMMRDDIDEATIALTLAADMNNLSGKLSDGGNADTLPDVCYANKQIRQAVDLYKETFASARTKLMPIAIKLKAKP